jgi:hypothetical protein
MESSANKRKLPSLSKAGFPKGDHMGFEKNLAVERPVEMWQDTSAQTASTYLTEERRAAIKLEDGSIIKGKINILAEPAHENTDLFLKHADNRGAFFNRISDIFTKGKNPFIVIYDAIVEGQPGRVLIINKKKILWVSPED